MSAKLPPWDPKAKPTKQAALRTALIALLDARDVGRGDQDLEQFAKLFGSLPERCPPPALDQHRLMQRLRANVAKVVWRHGNPQPLRKLHPGIDEVIPNEPPRTHGQRRVQPERAARNRRKQQAADDVRYLHALWQREPGHGPWKQGARPLAIDIAAQRHNVTTDEVEEALRRGTRRLS